MLRVKNINMVLTGVFLILVALLAFYVSWPLGSGTEVGLGPGYMPRVFAAVQFGLGVIMIVDGCVQAGQAPDSWHLRPLVLVLASVAFFAVTIERLGLVIALTGLVLIACTANRHTRFYEAAALAVGAVVFSVLVFVKALGLSLLLWPRAVWG